MTTIDTSVYTGLITSEHRGRPKFLALVEGSIQPSVDLQRLLLSMTTGVFDLDIAAGQQLDFIGQWIGLGRRLSLPISGVFFSFDTPGLGFDQGVWFNSSYASEGITSLDDGTYRIMLRAKAAANQWDGSLGDANAKLAEIFTGGSVEIEDNFDMSITINVAGDAPSVLFEELVAQGYIEFKPSGVRTT